MSELSRNLTIDEWVAELHTQSWNAGWWDDAEIRYDFDGRHIVISKYVLGTKLALIHSEVSELMEGMRKDSMDDHIPTRRAEEIEAADVFIRLLDYCGARNIDLAGAVLMKLEYNKSRADHTPEARAAEGGKKF